MGSIPQASRGSCRVKEGDGPALGSGEERASAFLPGALEGSRSRGGAGGGPGGWPLPGKTAPRPAPPRDSLRPGRSGASRGGQIHRRLPPHAGGDLCSGKAGFRHPNSESPLSRPRGSGMPFGEPYPSARPGLIRPTVGL